MAEMGIAIGTVEETMPIMDEIDPRTYIQYFSQQEATDRTSPPEYLTEEEINMIRRRIAQLYEEEVERELYDNYDPVYTVV